MRLVFELRERIRAVFQRTRADHELDEELTFHLAMAIEDNLRRGMSSAEARRQALLQLGGLAQTREATRDARGVRPLETLVQDLRYALRGLRANPLFAVAVVLTLGLGVGASAAMFGVADALLLRPLPYGEPDRLVHVMPVDPETGSARPYMRVDEARTWAERDEVFDATFQHVRGSVLFTEGAEPVTLTIELVSPGFGETLRVRPALGRGFIPEDGLPGAEPVALISHGLWRSAYGGDRGVLGRTIELDGHRHTIVGVMPAEFKFPLYASTEAWVALREDGTAFGRRMEPVEMVGRTRSAAPVDVVQDRADVLAAALAEQAPREGGWNVRLTPMTEFRGGGEAVSRSIWFLATAVALILLVATLNAVNLLLVRGWSRTRELAVRIALGASRRRLVAQLMTESALLALLSGLVATVLSFVVLSSVQGILPGSFTFWTPYAIAVERRTLLFTFGAAALVGLAVGLVPALLATRIGSAAAEGALTPYAARTPVRSRLRRTLVVAEVSLSVALLVSAGLLLNSFVRLQRVDPGFRLDDVAILTLDLSQAGYPTGEARMGFLRRVEARVEAIPGVVEATTGGGALPAGGITFTDQPETDDGPVSAGGGTLFLPHTPVSPDFFDLFDVRPRAGRILTDADAGTDNVLVSAALARYLWGDANPIGRRFRPDTDWEWLTVVGVVDDLKLEGPEAPYGDRIFLRPASNTAAGYASIALRTVSDPRAYFAAVRAAVHALDPNQPISSLRTARAIYAETIDTPRFLLVVMAALSTIALVLAAVGVYGVLAYGVAQRRFDLGVRIALGARPAELSRRVLGEGLALAGIGAALGMAGALALSGLIRGLLFGVHPGDPLTLGAVVGVILVAAAAASWWPARRVTRIDPMAALRVD